MREVSNGTLSLRDVMRGVQLSVSFPGSPSPPGFLNYDENGAIPEGKGAGFMIEILDEVASRAGFTWRNSWTKFDDPEKYDKTWTELLRWQVPGVQAVLAQECCSERECRLLGPSQTVA